jgi:3'(2'), 5'-bisphosphate nucleotidase
VPKLSILAQIAKQAGDKILSMQEEVIANQNGEQETKPDGSIVTTADKTANKIVCEGLSKHFPYIPIVSEENPEYMNVKSLQADERFDTDPLDNTSGYVKGLDGFSVNIGRIKNGVPVEGVIYFPARQELYFTSDNGRAYLQHGENTPKEIMVKGLPLRNTLQVAVGFSEGHLEHLVGREYETKKLAAQLRTCKVACGECDISGINKGNDGGFNSWDVAGPHAVLIAAGGEIISTDGKPIRYEKGIIKLPDHIAGAKNVLLSLGLASKQDLNSGKKLQ